MVTETKATEKNWEELTPDEKLQKRIDAWLSADGLNFVSAEAEANYKARINRFLDAVTLRKTPDRVPIQPNLGAFLQQYYGYTQKDMMYDTGKANDATTKATLEFDVDMQLSAATNQIGRVFDILDYKQYNWPGQRVPDDGEFQFIEGEYLKDDEYDAFLQDPSGFWYRQLLPRTVGALEAFKNLSVPTYRNPSVADYGRKDIQEALKKLMAAGDEAVKFNGQLAAATKKLKEMGYPTFDGGTSSVPFDFIGDALRGTVAISVDMFRQPDRLLEALDRCVPLMIERGLASAKMGNAPVVGFAMHKGSDPYMSEKHFQQFYWPQFRKVMEALNDEGLIVRGGCQGFHDKRVETYATMPKGKVYWAMGYGTDFHRAKSVLDGIACITGNVHAALLHQGTVQEVEDYCKDVIAVAGKGGGYIFGTSSIDRNAKPVNVRAMVAAAKKYGLYQ